MTRTLTDFLKTLPKGEVAIMSFNAEKKPISYMDHFDLMPPELQRDFAHKLMMAVSSIAAIDTKVTLAEAEQHELMFNALNYAIKTARDALKAIGQ